ncbi:MAG: TadE/TadG family type IV pilus assembly protein [Hyphomicrobiaceae bacterium]|jgi:hypothetical protein
MPLIASIPRLVRSTSGAVAIESAAILTPLFLILIGSLQFALYVIECERLGSTVYELSSSRQAELTDRSQSEVAGTLCQGLALVEECPHTIRVQLAPLLSYPSIGTEVDENIFDPGSAGAIMLLRTEAAMMSFIPGVGRLPIRATAIYMRS